MLPSFLPVHRWYGLAVIEQVLEVVVENADEGDTGARGSRYELEEQVEALGPSARTGWRWAASLGVHAGVWLAAVMTVLAKYAPQTRVFERPSLSRPARLLLDLGPIFVGWVARQGRDDWIMELWMWGHARGLTRLV